MNSLLYDKHKEALAEIAENGGVAYNWLFNFEIPVIELGNISIEDQKENARQWRSVSPPDNFYFSHAQYYKDGIAHIIRELKKKPSSNRALYSLMNQENISESDDLPIPSFLTMQCQISNQVLMATCCFRALEVDTFLKINLEEIRQNLAEITDQFPGISKINLTIFSFKAYIQRDFHPLIKPKIEYLKDDQILVLLQQKNGLSNLVDLVSEAKGAISIVPATRFIDLKRILSNACENGNLIDPEIISRSETIYRYLEECIHAASNLMRERQQGSFGEKIDVSTISYMNALENLVQKMQR